MSGFASEQNLYERLKLAPFKPLKAEAGNAQKRPLAESDFSPEIVNGDRLNISFLF